jgi:hypothetical protein
LVIALALGLFMSLVAAIEKIRVGQPDEIPKSFCGA